MLRQNRGGKAEGAGRDCFTQQLGDAADFLRTRRPFHRFFAHHVMAERTERRRERQIDGAAAARRRVHVLGEALPLPGQSPIEHLERDGFDRNQVPRRNLVLFGPAGRQPDAAVAHHDGGHAMPR
jgi:hypothetical protein